MMDFNLYPIFYDNMASLKETSKDDSDPNNIQYMTSSEAEVVNFDLVKRKYANGLGLSEEVATSVDAVISFSDGVLFVEFKNGKVNNRDIKDKVRDSLLIFLEIIKNDIDFSRNNIDFVLVYNIEKNALPNQLKKGEPQETPSRVFIADYFAKKAKREFIRFDLEKYEGLYFRNIHTYSKERFEEYFKTLVLS